MGFTSHHPLSLPQEKERNAKRKKKKGAAVQNEEAAFPPAAEDEEMEVSGTSGNEEEMAEEAEGEAGGGCGRECAQLCWLCCPVTCTVHGLSGAANVSTHKGSVTPKSHRGDGVPQHKALVAFWVPLDFTLARSVLDHCPPPVSGWMDSYFWEPFGF